MSHFDCRLNRRFWRSKKVVQVVQICGGEGIWTKSKITSVFPHETVPHKLFVLFGHLFSVIVAPSIKSGWPKTLGNVAFCHKVPTIKGKVKCGSQGKSCTSLISGALIFYDFTCSHVILRACLKHL